MQICPIAPAYYYVLLILKVLNKLANQEGI